MPDETQVPGQESQAPPQAPDYAGFDDTNQLAQAYRGSSAEARRQKERADLLEQQFQQAIQPRQQPSQDPFQRLREEGWPVDQLLPVIEAIADRKANDRFDPIVKGLAARGQVLSEYPDYGKFENDVNAYINADPRRQQTYNMMLNNAPEAAMEWAHLKYGESKRRASPNGTPSDKSSRADAQIPSSRSGENRNRNESDDKLDIMKRAREDFQRTGNPAARDAFVKAKLGIAIPDSFFQK